MTAGGQARDGATTVMRHGKFESNNRFRRATQLSIVQPLDCFL